MRSGSSGRCAASCLLVRYADDFVCMVQYQDDAQYIVQALRERFTQFDLELHPEKTRVISFGRYERQNAQRAAATAEHLRLSGLHPLLRQRSRWGKFIVGRKTSRKKFRKKCQELNAWLKAVRNRCPVKEVVAGAEGQTAGPLPVLRDQRQLRG